MEWLELDHVDLIRARKRRKKPSSQCGLKRKPGPKQKQKSFICLFKENTTIHGLRDILVSPRPDLTAIWVVLIVFAFILTLQGCSTVIREYMQKRVVVSYYIRESETLPLPDIVICPFNRFNRTWLETHGISFEMAQLVEATYPTMKMAFQSDMIIQLLSNQNYKRIVEEFEDSLKNLSITYDDFLSQAAHKCEAYFDDASICINATHLGTSVGTCFRIQGGNQKGDGFGSGKQIVIKIPKDEQFLGYSQWANDGVAIKLVEKNNGVDHDLSFAPTGAHVLMPLTATQYEFMNDPPRYMCVENTETNYSRVWCYDQCVSQTPEAFCNCSLAGSVNPRRQTCDPRTFFDCYLPHHHLDDSEIHKKCKASCKPPCNYWSFSKTISYAKFPSPLLEPLINRTDLWTQLQNTIVLDVYYQTLEHTVIRHIENMPPSSAIAQFGGQLSLWAGASIMSIIQGFVYGLYILFYHIVQKLIETGLIQRKNHTVLRVRRVLNIGTDSLTGNARRKSKTVEVALAGVESSDVDGSDEEAGEISPQTSIARYRCMGSLCNGESAV